MSDNDGASMALPSGSAIELDKTATLDPAAAGDPLRADAGDTVAYAFAISNTGNTTLSGVTLVDPLADPATGAASRASRPARPTPRAAPSSTS